MVRATIDLFTLPKYKNLLALLAPEQLLPLYQQAEQFVREASVELSTRFALELGLEPPMRLVPMGDGAAQGDGNMSDGGSGVARRRWSRAAVHALANEVVDPARYGGVKRQPSTLASNSLALEIIEVLGTYGPMTVYQLHALFTLRYSLRVVAPPPFYFYSGGATTATTSQTLRSAIQRALQFAQLQKMVTFSPVVASAGWRLPSQSPSYSRLKQPMNGSSSSSTTPALNNTGKAGKGNKPRSGGGGGRPQNLWLLDKPGEVYYQELTHSSDAAGGGGVPGAIGAEYTAHVFGIQQTLALFYSLCATNNRLGSLDQMLQLAGTHQAEDEHDSIVVDDSVEGAAVLASPSHFCRVELSHWGTALWLKQEERYKLIPDALGRLVLDTGRSGSEELPGVEARLLAGSNISADSEDGRFTHLGGGGGGSSGGSRRLVWPFALEYDRSTETAAVFGSKYKSYSVLANATIKATAWPPEWGDKFPVILVVVEGGGPARLLALMEEIRRQVLLDKNSRKRVTGWWFTCVEWLTASLGPYLLEAGGGRGGGSSTSSSTSSNKLTPTLLGRSGITPHIWIPLHLRPGMADLQRFSTHLLLLLLANSTKLQQQQSIAPPSRVVVVPPAPEIASQFCSLPLPLPLNS